MSAHVRGVSCLAANHASKIALGPAGELIGLLHDFGKYSLAFQRYLKSAEGLIDPDGDDYIDAEALRGKVDHSTAGAQYIWSHLSTRPKWGPFVGQILALCIASHHSGLIDCISAHTGASGDDIFTRRMNKPQARTHLGEVVQAADPEILARASELVKDEALLECIEILSKRIFHSNQKSAIGRHQQLGLMVRFLFSCLIDADRTDTADCEKKRVKSFRQRGSYVDWALARTASESGSMFVVFGYGLGPYQLQQANAYPLPTALAGTSVKITVGKTIWNAIMIYTSAYQVAAIMPSTVTTGDGTLTVSYNGRTSPAHPIKIVPSGFGIYTISSNGIGAGIITTADYRLRSFADSAIGNDSARYRCRSEIQRDTDGPTPAYRHTPTAPNSDCRASSRMRARHLA